MMGAFWQSTKQAFGTTDWRTLNGLHAEDAATREAAMSRIIETYWPCVYAWCRQRGHDRHAAAELTQGFFADVVIGRGLLGGADAEKGRARSLILTALKNYEVDCARKAISRGLGKHVSEECLEYEEHAGVTDSGSADDAFDQRWAMGMFTEALRRVESHFECNGRSAHWKLFERRVLRPTSQPLGDLALELGFGSAADGAAAVQSVKRRVQAVLREVVAEQTNDGESASGDYEEVVRLLG